MLIEKSRTRILRAAEELISENGICDTTIAKVARKAGVADSLVYKYFKGKEDLLFSIALERLHEALEQFEEALQGIQDPESRLSKMLWYSLRYNDRHPGYTRILLFECRSNPNFYVSPGYELLRKHANITMDILRQGVKDGIFRKDIDIRLVRDIIYGILDFEAITSIAAKEIGETIGDFDDIMALLLGMVSSRERYSELGNEERILFSAEKAFSKYGFAKAKISDIAKEAQIAEGTIYEYFKSKEDLLLSIPLKRFQDHLNQLEETFQVLSPLRKLRRLLRYHFTLYLPNRDFLKVFLLDIQLNMQFYSSKAYQSFRQYMQAIEQVIEEGKSKGTFRPDVNARVFRNMFLGAFTHMALRWVIFGHKKRHDKMMEVDNLVDLMSSAVSLDP